MSREYRGKRVVVYTSYLDSNLPRRLGRRISREEAVPNPRIEELYEAALELGLNPEIEKEARHPRTWFTHRGRIIVDKVASKQELLRLIASKVREKRRKRR